MSKAWRAYNQFMDLYPFTSNLFTAGVLYGAGDLLCQGIELYKYGTVVTKSTPEPSRNMRNEFLSSNSDIKELSPYEALLEKVDIFDYGRILRMTIHGTIIFGISSYYWYAALDKYLAHLRTHAQVFAKVALDEFIYAPFSIASLFASLSFMEGKNKTDITEKIKRDFWTTFTVDLIIWPVLQGINFYFLPLKYRVLYISVCSLFWNIFLSSMHNNTLPAPEKLIPQDQV